MKRFAGLFALLVLIHFVATWVCFTKSAVIKPGPYTHAWGQAAEILAIPFVYLEVGTESDFLLAFMIGNSILWAALLTAVVMLAIRFRSPKN